MRNTYNYDRNNNKNINDNNKNNRFLNHIFKDKA